MTDAQRYADLLVADIDANNPISTRDIEMYLQAQGKLLTIYDHASDVAREIVLSFSRFESFDMDNTQDNTVLTDMLSALVTGSILTAGQATAIADSGKTLISRAEELGVPVTLKMVEEAR